MNYQQFLELNRKTRSRLLEPAGKFLLKFKITANQMTFVSFVFGLISVYFLFQMPFLFIIFAVLHLLADCFDGVLARLTKPNIFGKYFDYFTDRSISVFVLIKIYFYLQDYYVVFIIFLFILSQAVHVLSKFEYPIIFIRTGSLIYLSFSPLFPFIPFLTIGYLVAGIISLFSLLLQLKHFLRIRTYSS